MSEREQDTQIFREKSLEQLSAPEQLMDYLRVTGPGIWLILIGIAVLLAGVLIWGIVGNIYTTITVPAQVENGKIYCYVLKDDVKGLDDTDTVEITVGDQEMEASVADAKTIALDTEDAPQLYETGYLKAGKNVMVFSDDTDLKDGFYQADMEIEALKPISLLFAKN